MFQFCDFGGSVLRPPSCPCIPRAPTEPALTPLSVPIQVPQGCSQASPAPGDAPVHLRLLLRAPWLLQDEEEERRVQRGAGDGSVRSRLMCASRQAVPRDPIPFPSVCRDCQGGHLLPLFFSPFQGPALPGASPSACAVPGCLRVLGGCSAELTCLGWGRGRWPPGPSNGFAHR